MAYLNWKSHSLKLTSSAHPVHKTQLELELTAELARELVDDLRKSFPQGGGPSEELKLELPDNWTLYWKAKTGLSRMQLAHPQTNQWVATIHLTETVGASLVAALLALHSSSGRLALSSLGALAPINNFELILVAV